jgi:RNA polymerase sigma factor (sigma-70 family)
MTLDATTRLVESSNIVAEPRASEAVESIQSLTRRLAQGDETAFREFHDRFFDRLYRFLLALARRGEEHAAQEALQETMLRVARYIRCFESEALFWSWLKMVARSAARDAGRKQRRYERMLERFALAWRSAPMETSPEEGLLQDLLTEVLDELETDDRELIEQKYLGGASVKELADATGLTEKAVESRLLRLRRCLRATLLERLKAL